MASSPPLLAARPVFDAHVDSIGRAVDFGHDLGQRGPGHLDLVRGAEGGLGSVVFACWVDPEVYAADPTARARAMAGAVHDLARRHPDQVRLVGRGPALQAARSAGQVAAILGMEGGHPLDGDLDRLEWFFARGLRVLTLVWNNHLPWIRSCQPGAGEDVPAGLSDFGRQVVERANDLGIGVDVSHAGEQSFHDVLDVTTKPVIASHSGCREVHDHPRNLRDDQLRRLADNGGVIGIVFCPPFLDGGTREAEERVMATPEYKAAEAEKSESGLFTRMRLLQERADPVDPQRVVDHIVHAVEVAGIDHVGIGSDYDGIQRTPQGLEDASRFGFLAALLLERGFDETDALKILGGNMERVFAEVTGPGTTAHTAEILPMGEGAS